LGKIVTAGELHGGFVNMALSSQWEKEGSSIKKPKVPVFLKWVYQTTSYSVPAGWIMKPAAMGSEDLLRTILHPNGHC
jgi:hypothetical protein